MNLSQILSSILRAQIPSGHARGGIPRREADPIPPGVPRRAYQLARAARRRMTYCGRILSPR